MAAPYETPVPGGLQVPFSMGEGLNVPGRDERPREERLEQLKGLLATAGSAIVGAVNSEARIAAMAKARAEERRRENAALANWVKNRKAEEDNERQAAYRQAAKGREDEIRRTQFELLRDPRSENSEWVLNEAVMRQNNAEFQDEKDAWMGFILQHQEAARTDTRREAEKAARVANSQLVNNTRIAARTAKNAIDDIANDIDLDGDLQAKLIGDGRGINERVHEHVLQVAMSSAPELFNLRRTDPMYAEKLEQQQILLDQLEARAQTAIVNPLTKQHITNATKAMEAAGATRMEVAALSFAEGDLSAEQYHDLVGDTLRTQFAHVDPKQRDGIREKLYRDQFDRLAKLLDQPNPGMALERMEALMGVADLNSQEKNIIREQIIGDKFPKAINDRLKKMFDMKKAEMSGVTLLNGGRTASPRDPRIVELDMLEGGVYRDIAGQMLVELGITDPANLTPLQANLLVEIETVTMKAEESAARHRKDADESVEIMSRFYSKSALTADEAGKAWANGGLMRMLGGKMSPDDPVMQGILSQYRAVTGKDLEWQPYAPIPLNKDTMPLMRDIARDEARAWGSNSIVQIPRALSQTIENMALYESPERAEVAVSFWSGLGPEGQQRLGQTLSPRAQLVLAEANRLSTLTSNDPTVRGFNYTDIVNRVRKIEDNTASAVMFLSKEQAGLHSLIPDDRFKYEYAQALSSALQRDVLKDEYGSSLDGFDVDIETGLFDPKGRGALQGLSAQLGGQPALVPLFQQMALVQQSNPGISLEEAGQYVVARMRSQGYKVVQGPKKARIIKDQWDHYPTDITPSVLLQQKLAEPRSSADVQSFLSRLPNVGPKTSAMARNGAPLADVLWSHVQEIEGPNSVIPHPREWAFLPETEGPMFSASMSKQDGGVPMVVVIPGIGRTQMFTDLAGNPLLTVSSKERVEVPLPVNKARIPDYFLTTKGRKRIGLKPDAAGKMAELMSMADAPYGGPTQTFISTAK